MPRRPQFLLSRAYNIPQPTSAEELEMGVEVLRNVFETYPQDKLAIQAEYEIGLSYYHFGRYEDAVSAFQAYLEKYEGKPTPDPSQEGNLAEMLAQARYTLGKVYQQQRKSDDALRVWSEFLQQYPADQHWSEVQRLMIDTEYLTADKLLREEAYQEARAAWEGFLSAYPLDQRNPEIMFRIGETIVKEAEEPTPGPSQEGNTTPGPSRQRVVWLERKRRCISRRSCNGSVQCRNIRAQNRLRRPNTKSARFSKPVIEV
jgi:tetratricopeptide (TPR) repeat protein